MGRWVASKFDACMEIGEKLTFGNRFVDECNGTLRNGDFLVPNCFICHSGGGGTVVDTKATNMILSVNANC